MGVPVDLIEPMGFAWDDARVRRTAMDYIDHVEVTRHAGFEAYLSAVAGARLCLFTSKATLSPYDHLFKANDILLSARKVPVSPHPSPSIVTSSFASRCGPRSARSISPLCRSGARRGAEADRHPAP
jgi:tRNA (cytidine/uridine-2'-O-)-methyltransferase